MQSYDILFHINNNQYFIENLSTTNTKRMTRIDIDYIIDLIYNLITVYDTYKIISKKLTI